jgi:hypothetical protein
MILEAWDRMKSGELPCPEPYDGKHAAFLRPAEFSREAHPALLFTTEANTK